MNFTLKYHCPLCFKEFGNSHKDEILARLHCAPQAKTVFRCAKCKKPARTIHKAMRCCTPRDEVLIIDTSSGKPEKVIRTPISLDLL